MEEEVLLFRNSPKEKSIEASLITLRDLVSACNIPSKDELLGVLNVHINWNPIKYFNKSA